MILGECGTRDLDKLDGSCTTSKSQSDQGIAHCCQNCLFYNKVKLLTIKLKMDNKPTCKLLMFTAMPYWSSFILICRPQSDWSSETWNLHTMCTNVVPGNKVEHHISKFIWHILLNGMASITDKDHLKLALHRPDSEVSV